jgi:uncharacterized membrane protein
MDKETFYTILQSALLAFDGVSEEELVKKYNLPENLAKSGVKLSLYLKSIEIKKSFLNNGETLSENGRK